MLYVLWGKDQFRAREELGRIRSELDTDGNLVHNTVRIEGTEVRALKPAELRTACHTASFFAENRLVIVDGLLGKLGGSRRRGRARPAAAAKEAPSSEADQFLEVLDCLPESTTVVLLDENVADGLRKELEARPEVKVRQFAPLKGDQLRGWAAERVRSLGATFAAGALDRLISLIDGNFLGELAMEIDKLVTYTNGRQVEIRDVDEMVSGAVQFETWDLTDAVIDGRADRALNVWSRMRIKEHPTPMLAAVLVGQYRRIMLAQAYLREGLSATQIGSQMGLVGFPLKKAIDQASRYQSDRLEIAYRRLLEHDIAVKTGVLQPETAFPALIVSLAELARAPTRRSAPMRR